MHRTESPAGSDLGAIRARAEKAADGSVRLYGQNIFNTDSTDNYTDNIIHLVLARSPDGIPGTKGLSLYIVPKFLVNPDGSLGARNDAKPISLEHKLGIDRKSTRLNSSH